MREESEEERELKKREKKVIENLKKKRLPYIINILGAC